MTSNFEATLREHGYRVTRGRVALLAALSKNGRPISAERAAQAVGKELDAANVYRALESFVKSGIVRRVDVGHQHMHYALALGQHRHQFVCATCGVANANYSR